MIVLAQIEQAMKGLDHASSQGDRWMACIFLLALAVVFVGMFRYFKEREDKREERFMAHAEKELAVSEARTIAVLKHNDLLTEMHEKLDELMERQPR